MDTNCKACSAALEPAEALATELDQALDATDLALLQYQYTQGGPEDVSALYGVLRPLADRFLVRVAGVCSLRCKQALSSVVAALVVLMIGSGCASKVDAADVPARLPDPPATLLLMAGENFHVVSAGQSPSKVAGLYSVAIKALTDRNPGRWQVGQTIVIPAPKPESIRCQNVWIDASNITDADVEACLF
jgi:hypothetical protein